MVDTYTLARQTALYSMYKKHRLGGLFRVGEGSIHLIVTITSPVSTQVTARHYDKNSKYILLQWLEVRKVNGKERISGYAERIQ